MICQYANPESYTQEDERARLLALEAGRAGLGMTRCSVQSLAARQPPSSIGDFDGEEISRKLPLGRTGRNVVRFSRSRSFGPGADLVLLSGVGLSVSVSVPDSFLNVFGSGAVAGAGDGIDSEYGRASWVTVPPAHEEQPEPIGLPTHKLHGVYGAHEP